ncbi:MAG: PAS domain S-box protein [Candidatus Sumerlaeota bacterium]|nr:PAS domain S-box protein [Candidatus Sumerlaeota bacterium]
MIAEEQPPLKTEEFEYRGKPILRVMGRLDMETAARLPTAVRSLTSRGSKEVVLDLSGLAFIDSVGIGQLVKLHESLRLDGCRLVLQWTPPKIIDILNSAGLDTLFDIRPDPRKAPRAGMEQTRERLLGNLRPCWELFGCEDRACRLFGKPSYVCWTLPRASCKAVKSPDLMEEIASCSRCVVFENNVQSLGEIHTHFTNYVSQAEEAFARVRERATALEAAVEERSKQLELSESRYRDLFEEATETLFELEGTPATIVALNLEFERLTGLAREAWVGRSFFDLARKQDRAEVRRHYQTALEGQKTQFELRVETGPGQQRVVWCSLRPLIHDRPSRVRGALGDITELVRVREEHSRLYQAIQGISDYVVILDERSRVVFVNEAFCKAWGYKDESEIVGRSSSEVETGLPPGYWDRVRKEASRNGVWRGETTARRRDRTEFPIELHVTPIYDDQGKPRLIVGVSRDISARREMEAALRQSRQKAARMIEGAADPILVIDAERRILQANKKGCEFFGATFSEMEKVRLDDLWPKTALRSLEEDMRRLFKSGHFLDQLTFASKSGDEIEAEVNATDLGDGTYIAILRDISLRERVEREHRGVREQFEAVFRSIVDGVLLLDSGGRVALHNQQFLDLLGLTAEEVEGMSAQALYGRIAERADDARDFQHWIQSISTESSSVARRELRLNAPERRMLLLYTAPVRSGRNAIVGRVWMLRDVTEQRRLQEQLLQSQKMESIGTLAGGVAHDFNNLLTGILGFTSSLLESIPPGHPHYRALRNIDASAQRAAELTQGMLAFARRNEPRMRPLQLNDVVQDALRLLSRTLPKQIELASQLAPNLPAIRGDAIQLEQVIMNLCVNARDAMPDGGQLRLSTLIVDSRNKPLPADVTSPTDQFVVLRVEDTGCGMAPDVVDRIFEPFFTTKETGKGTGLGLALAYGIARSHGGFIEVQSELGQGARFDIYFPPTKAALENRPRAPETAPAPGRGELVLLVDDEPVVREVALTVLEQLGYRVIAAEGGQEALDLYRKRGAEIDLVLLDLMMPRMRGEKVFQRLREMNPQARIIISTGNPDLIERFPDLKQYAAGFANKPYRVGELGQALEAALAK